MCLYEYCYVWYMIHADACAVSDVLVPWSGRVYVACMCMCTYHMCYTCVYMYGPVPVISCRCRWAMFDLLVPFMVPVGFM